MCGYRGIEELQRGKQTANLGMGRGRESVCIFINFVGRLKHGGF